MATPSGVLSDEEHDELKAALWDWLLAAGPVQIPATTCEQWTAVQGWLSEALSARLPPAEIDAWVTLLPKAPASTRPASPAAHATPTSLDGTFDVALTFANEEADVARALEEALRAEGFRVFFDPSHSDALWGRGTYDTLHRIYSLDRRWCIPPISRRYLDKPWTRQEWTWLRMRSMHDPDSMLPVSLDGTLAPGWNSLHVKVLTTTSISEVVAALKGRQDAAKTVSNR